MQQPAKRGRSTWGEFSMYRAPRNWNDYFRPGHPATIDLEAYADRSIHTSSMPKRRLVARRVG